MQLLCLTILAGFLFQGTTTPPKQPTQQTRFEGIVLRAGTGQPVPGARATVTRLGKLPPGLTGIAAQTMPSGLRIDVSRQAFPIVTTDDKGKFVLQGLDEGAYEVQVDADGYVGSGTMVELDGGQATKDLSISLTAVANVSGRIHDASNQPVVQVPVQLLRVSYDFRGRRSYKPVGTALTNDRGEYRMYWVTPGRYYLLAGRPTAGANPLADMVSAVIGGVTAAGNRVPPVLGYVYYPGVTDFGNARTIDLQPASDLQVDLTLIPNPRTYTVRGKLIDSRTGERPPRASVLVTAQNPGSDLDAVIADPPSHNYDEATGTILIRDVLPGTYTITAIIDGPTQSFGTIPVTVTSANVDGIVVTVHPAATISGRVTVEGEFKAPMSIDHLRVMLVPIGPIASSSQEMQNRSLAGLSQGAAVGADGAFRINGVIPGDYRVEVYGFPIGGPRFIATMVGNGFIKTARFEGVDVANNPLQFSGVSSGSLDILVTLGGGQLSGAVTDARSKAVAGATVVLLPERARFRSDLYRTASTDETGTFSFSALPPGDYKIFSWESIEEFAWFDSDLMARLEAMGAIVHVSETAPTRAALKLIPAETTP